MKQFLCKLPKVVFLEGYLEVVFSLGRPSMTVQWLYPLILLDLKDQCRSARYCINVRCCDGFCHWLQRSVPMSRALTTVAVAAGLAEFNCFAAIVLTGMRRMLKERSEFSSQESFSSLELATNAVSTARISSLVMQKSPKHIKKNLTDRSFG